MRHVRSIVAVVCVLMSVLWSPVASGRQQDDAASSFTEAQLDQILAPVALYPDSLISQVFMASTYPLEVVQADRWVKKNSGLAGAQLEKALEAEDWDASVKSLTNFPDVLAMMSEDLDWTTSLGDAFIAQQDDVLASVQRLRARAMASGNLKDTDQQTIVIEESQDPQVIVIESRSPEVVYVPVYNPVVVYGTWPYPSYPPRVYYPPGYVATASVVSFTAGVALGAAWGYAWGNCNWRGGDIDIDVNRNANFNRNINRDAARANLQQRPGGREGTWKHDGSHRRGVSYRDQSTARKYNQGPTRDAARARESYRGRADAGARDLARGGAGSRDRQQPAARPGTGTSRDRGSRTSRGSSAFGGSQRSGQATRAASSRGHSSRSGARGGASRGGSRGGARGGSRGGGRRGR
ncbi:MAG: DUF3300 domain-containing protein [Planctomycetota bacterium]|jgi:hypothetical protein